MKVSVIISVYNDRRYLRDSIQSLLDQSFNDYEIIVIDDGSTDGSTELIREFADSGVIKGIFNAENIGLTKSLNKGIDAAQGEYLARQDIDDLSNPLRLERQVDYLDQHKDVFLVGQNNRTDTVLDENGKVIRQFKATPTKNVTADDLLEENIIRHSSIMFRNAEIKYREKFYYAQDRDLYFRLLGDGKKIVLLGEDLVKGRIHPGNINSGKSNKQGEFVAYAEKFYQERMERGHDSYDDFQPVDIVSTPDNVAPLKQYNLKKLRMSLAAGNKKSAREAYRDLRVNGFLSRKAQVKYWLTIVCPNFCRRLWRTVRLKRQ